MLGVSLGILLAKYMPWADRERWEAVSWTAHLKGILLFALPDTFFTAAILFAAAVVWRRDIASFIAAILLLAGRAVTVQLLQGPQWDRIRSLFDPYGVNTFLVVTKYWTVADKNILSLSFSGLLLWNRLIWLGVGCAAFALAYSRFSFTERRTKTKALEPDAQPAMAPAVTPAPHPQLADSPWAKFLGSFRIHFRGMAKNTAFVVVVMIASMICTLALALQATQFQGNQTVQTFPVTYWVIELIRGTLDFLLIVIITYFSGALVWKDRDERMDEIADATPTPEWVSYAARLVTLVGMVMLIQTVALAGRHRRAGSSWLLSLPVRSLCSRIAGARRLMVCPYGDSGILYPGSGAQQVRGIFRFHSLLFRKQFSVEALERGHKPGSICGKAQRHLFGFLRRCALSSGMGLVHSLLAAFLRAHWPSPP